MVAELVDSVRDGSFEGGSPNPFWAEGSSTADAVIERRPAAARTGLWVCVFGSVDPADQVAWVEQEITLGAGAADLGFFVNLASASGNGQDTLHVIVDGVEVFAHVVDSTQTSAGYTEVGVNLAAFADGGPHLLRFEVTTYDTGGASGTLFLLDDVSVITELEPLVADFEWSPQLPVAGDVVDFSDRTSGDPIAWSWHFGDGFTSEEQEPSHVFAAPGSFAVSLTATGADGASDTAVRTVHVRDVLRAQFSWSPLAPEAGDPVHLTDESTGGPNAWSWDFGDGATSNEPNPVHVFDAPGAYEVTLTVDNDSSTDSITRTVVVTERLRADFSWSPLAPEAGEPVHLTDQSAGDPTAWSWDFGDGATSGEPNPVHVFDAPGAYEVTLTVGTAGETDSITRTIVVGQGLEANFSWSPTLPEAGQDVQFTDESIGDPSDWSWDFGDGATSNEPDPIHVFGTPGHYDVTLTVDTVGETDSITRRVVVSEGLEADFSWSPNLPEAGEPVDFTDESSGDPGVWFWDFDDGFTSEQQHPSHAFDTAGAYDVTLTVSNTTGNRVDSITRTVVVTGRLQAAFSWSPLAPEAGEPVDFTDESSGDPGVWFWDFDDGFTSEQQHPSHAFDTAGTYDVTLTVTGGPDASVVDSVTRTVVVHDALTAHFTWAPHLPAASEEVQFTDLSTGDPASWAWDLGDGSTSEEQHPSHVYDSEGVYEVTLTVTGVDAGGASTLTRNLVVTRGLTADFRWAPQLPEPGEAVRFIDLSAGDPVAWNWDLGDGSTSTEQHPVHAYDAEGVYDVTLTVTDADGATAGSITRPIEIAETLRADFAWTPLTPEPGEAAHFVDLSTGHPASWHWVFDDGTTSDEPDPTHAWEAPGTYSVTLTVTRAEDGVTSSTSKTVVVVPRLIANFRWAPAHPLPGQEVQLTDLSTGNPSSWLWGLGDGSTSEEQHPVHVYSDEGAYDVVLTVTGHLPDRISTATKTIVVGDAGDVGFTWTPLTPEAGEEVQFQAEAPGELLEWSWYFGDGGTSSEQNPSHVFDHAGAYVVTLWVTDASGALLAAERAITVLPREAEAALTVSTRTPEIGELVVFTIVGVDTVDAVAWDFGGVGCGAQSQRVTCEAGTSGCLTQTYRFATSGVVAVTADILVGDVTHALRHPVRVLGTGSCGEPPQADLSWWPQAPGEGDSIRFVDRSTGPPQSWLWEFGDGQTSARRHPRHVYQSGGSYTVTLSVANELGASSASRVVDVTTAAVLCGDGVCEEDETAYTCPEDCALPEGVTGRAGGAETVAFIPAVVGGIAGVGGTMWTTEGMVFNPGDSPSTLVLEYRPDTSASTVVTAQPFTLPPRTAFSFDNLVVELFGATENGSLWLDADSPVLIDLRIFNTTERGTFGQAIAAVDQRSVLGQGDGALHFLGISEDGAFRTNMVIQEVSGAPVEALVSVYRSDGSLAGDAVLVVEGHGKVQGRLRNLGISDLARGYATVTVSGEGRVAALASVIDAITGDATTIDAVHSAQVVSTPGGKVTGPDAGKQAHEPHFLVAVVARSPGANSSLWRSELEIQNPDTVPQELEVKYFPTGGEPLSSQLLLEPGHQFVSSDVIGDVFPGAPDGTGALHVYATTGVIVSSRTYNQLPSGGTMGQAIPGLGPGDMAQPGELWVLNRLKQTDEFRCNIGFAEFTGEPSEVTVGLFDMSGASMRFLYSKTYAVGAFTHHQVYRIFDDMEIPGQYEEAMAYVMVSSDVGALYVYASIVDNGEGDATTVLANRVEE